MKQNKRIYIIGGGIIGSSTAYFLAKSGAKVTLLEKNKLGQGCSFANAGWLTPCFAMPLPMPGMFFQSFRWLLNPNSPLYIKPSLHPDLIRWLITFLRSMNSKQALASIEALIHLSKRSLDLYAELSKSHPDRMAFDQKGLLMVAKTQSGMKAILEELELGAKFGVMGKVLSAADCQDAEPALKSGLLGGVHFLDEAHAEPYATTQLLAELARSNGAEILEEAEFLGWSTSGNSVEYISYQHNNQIFQVPVEQLLLTTGSWSKSLGKKLGIHLPILGGKGYSMSVEEIEVKPKIPIMYLEKKIAITPRQNGVRIAGTLELVDQDFSITERRVRNIQKGASEIIGTKTHPTIDNLWAGLRPCSPDGVPLIGGIKKYQNLFVGLGHQMLGFQSGIGSGELLSQLMNGSPLSSSEQVFDPNRF